MVLDKGKVRVKKLNVVYTIDETELSIYIQKGYAELTATGKEKVVKKADSNG